MFTVMFALGRLPGWIAQWKEMRENKEPIGRPRQIYTGELERDYTESAPVSLGCWLHCGRNNKKPAPWSGLFRVRMDWGLATSRGAR